MFEMRISYSMLYERPGETSRDGENKTSNTPQCVFLSPHFGSTVPRLTCFEPRQSVEHNASGGLISNRIAAKTTG